MVLRLLQVSPEQFNLGLDEDFALLLGCNARAWERLRLPLQLGLALVDLTVGEAEIVEFVSNSGKEMLDSGPLLGFVIRLSCWRWRGVLGGLDAENGGNR